MDIAARPIPARPLWGGHFLSGPWLGQAPGAAVRCCPNPNAPPGQEMPCYDEQGNLVYYTDSKHSYGQCSMPTAPPPAGSGAPNPPPAPGTPLSTKAPTDQLPNLITQAPPAKVTFPIANLSFPGGMEEPPLQQFTHLAPGTPPRYQMMTVVGPTTVYPSKAKPVMQMTQAPQESYPVVQVLPQPPGTVIPVQDYFRRA